jgi:hypothetical protein
MSDRALAQELVRALDGEAAGDEARSLAALLSAAAEPASFAVNEQEVDSALARVDVPRRDVRPHLFRVGIAAAVVAAVAVLAFLPRTPGGDVQARAARAVEASFFIDVRIRALRPLLFPATEVNGYVDGRNGRAHLRIYSADGTTIAETVVNRNGSVERWQLRSNTITLAPSCAALPGGCGETFDPFGLYVRALESKGVRVRRLAGSYELTLQAGRLEEVVQVDEKHYLPRLIVWRQGRLPLARITFSALERTAQQPPETWRMSPHEGARHLQLTGAGRPVRVLGFRPVKPRAGLRWLGPEFDGVRAQVDDVTLTGGRATRILYGRLAVWNYRRIIPPPVIRARGPAVKVFALPNGAVVHVYYGDPSVQVAEVSYGGETNAAVVSSGGNNVDVVRAAELLTRRGSP